MRKKISIDEYRQTFLLEDRLQELYDQNLFKLFVPKKYGGLELDLDLGVHHLLHVASMQGGLGWSLNLGAGANWFSGFLSDSAAQEIFSPREAVIAGSGFASGSFRQENDQFMINGTWSRCTGAHYATFFSLNAKNEQGAVKTFVIPRQQVRLADEKWPIFGLRNSSSYAITIQQEKIPAQYEFEINAIRNTHAYWVHAVPFDAFARICMSASFLGIIQCLLEHCREYPLNAAALKRVEDHLEPLWTESERSCYNWAKRLQDCVQSKQMTTAISDQLKAELSTNNKDIFGAVQELFLLGGLPFVEEDTVVHWAYRDVLTAIQHPMVKG